MVGNNGFLCKKGKKGKTVAFQTFEIPQHFLKVFRLFWQTLETLLDFSHGSNIYFPKQNHYIILCFHNIFWPFLAGLFDIIKKFQWFRRTITIEWNGWRQSLERWFLGQGTIGNDGFRWLSAIGPTMEWFGTIEQVYPQPTQKVHGSSWGT